MTVSEFVDVANQTLEYSFSGVIVEGEVSQFKVSKDKFVFFDLKDEFSCVGCFMMKHQLHLPLENGMRISIKASVKLTQWGKFSLTVISILPLGDGAIKRALMCLRLNLLPKACLTQYINDHYHFRSLKLV